MIIQKVKVQIHIGLKMIQIKKYIKQIIQIHQILKKIIQKKLLPKNNNNNSKN